MGGWCAFDILHRVGYGIIYRGLKIITQNKSTILYKILKKNQSFVKCSYPYFKVYSTRDLILREEHVQLLKKLIPVMSSKENEISQNHIYPDLQQGTRVT